MSPHVQVDKPDALVDEIITISVHGLEKHQKITLRAEIIEKGLIFASTGCFVADQNGDVDVQTQASTSGTYTGVSAMGLFWSMKTAPGQAKGLRLIKNNASIPLMCTISVISRHVTFEETYLTVNKPLCSLSIRRWYMAKDVQKVKVRHGRIRGTLFLPPGRGPFPGVIDMFGTVGSLIEFRAALLASRGFATLALPYFLYDDLPRNMMNVELEYFLEATDWLSDHPQVISDNIGVIGVSKGGEVALHMGYYSDKIKAVVSINGAPFFTGVPMNYKGDYIGKSEVYPDAVIETDEGTSVIGAMSCKTENYLPIWDRDVQVMLIAGANDLCLNPDFLRNLYDCYPPERRKYCELVVYPGAGHLIEPPYAPLARDTISNLKGVGGNYGIYHSLWGGQTEDHAVAQEDSWNKILHLFRTVLPLHTDSSVHQSPSKL